MNTKEKNFQDSYVLTKTIGTGNTAIIRKCRHKFSKNFYACKIIKLSSNDEKDDHLCAVKNEISIVRKLKHSNVLLFIDVFYTQDNVMVITELTEFGDLHDYIFNHENVDETLSRSFSLDIASALNYMHSQNVVHRDIKPENCLLFKTRPCEDFTIKICDFGLANYVPMVGLKEVCGSPSYVAPEILQGRTYGLSVDIWSMGVLFFFLLCHCYPFEHNELSNKFDLIMFSNLDISALEWNSISSEAKDLVQNMLVRNPKKRLTANDVLYHKWFTTSLPQSHPSKPKISLKAVSIAVKTTKALEKTHLVPSRENAKLSRENAILSEQMIKLWRTNRDKI